MLVNFVQRKTVDPVAIHKCLADSYAINQLTNDGPVKRQLELYLHNKLMCGADRAVVCVSSGTSACHLLMLFYDEKMGRPTRWLVPAYTFPTPVVNGFGVERVRVIDIDPMTYTIPLDEKLLENYDGVILTNLFGLRMCDDWVGLCRSAGKLLILDNASSPVSFGAPSHSLSSLGDASFGSLHHTKYFGFGEGGFIVVPKADYETVNRLACFGFDSDRRYCINSSNFKMSDISAAYILEHIKSYNMTAHANVQWRLMHFIDTLEKCCILGQTSMDDISTVYGNLPVVFDKPIDVAAFTSLGVEAHKYYRPLVAEAPVSWDLFDRIINLPLHAGLTDYQVDVMQNVIRTVAR